MLELRERWQVEARDGQSAGQCLQRDQPKALILRGEYHQIARSEQRGHVRSLTDEPHVSGHVQAMNLFFDSSSFRTFTTTMTKIVSG